MCNAQTVNIGWLALFWNINILEEFSETISSEIFWNNLIYLKHSVHLKHVQFFRIIHISSEIFK